MRFISNVAGWTQLTQLFDFLSFDTEWLTLVISLLLFIHSLMNIFGPRRPSFELPIGEKREESRCPNMRCYRGYSPLEDYEICTVQKHSFYRKIKSFLVLELSSYILSVPSFSSLCWPYFSLEFPPLFWPLFAFYNRQNQSFFMDPFSRNNLFHPFSRFFFRWKVMIMSTSRQH